MKTFEERTTAWIDGQLTGAELAAFEKELEAQPEAALDRAGARQLGDLLRTHGTAPTLANADFFNLQIQQRIAAGTPPQPHAEVGQSGGFLWSLPRLLWAGAASLVVAGVLYVALVPAAQPFIEPSNYFAQVVEAWPSDPSISATTVYNPQDNLTVLWIDGMDYMPSEQLALQ